MLINIIFAIIIYLVIRFQDRLLMKFSRNMNIIGINGLRIAQGKMCEDISNDYNNPFFILQSHFYLAKRQVLNEYQNIISRDELNDYKIIFTGLEKNLESLRKKIATLNYLSVGRKQKNKNTDATKTDFYRDKEQFVTLVFWVRSQIIDRLNISSEPSSLSQLAERGPSLDVLISDIPSATIFGPTEVIVRSLTELVFDLLKDVKSPQNVLISANKDKDDYVLSICITSSEVITVRSKRSSSFLMIESVLNRGLGWVIEEVPLDETQKNLTVRVRIQNKRFH